jgi:hypothetical protein
MSSLDVKSLKVSSICFVVVSTSSKHMTIGIQHSHWPAKQKQNSMGRSRTDIKRTHVRCFKGGTQVRHVRPKKGESRSWNPTSLKKFGQKQNDARYYCRGSLKHKSHHSEHTTCQRVLLAQTRHRIDSAHLSRQQDSLSFSVDPHSQPLPEGTL